MIPPYEEITMVSSDLVHRRIKLIFILASVVLLMGCVDIDVDINFNSDGSGVATMKITVPAGIPSSEVMGEVNKNLGKKNWSVREQKQDNGETAVIATKAFKSFSEVQDDLEIRGRVDVLKNGFRRQLYCDLVAEGNPDMKHYQVNIKVPYPIKDANTGKRSSYGASWDLTGKRNVRLNLLSEGIIFLGSKYLIGFAVIAIAALVIFLILRKRSISGQKQVALDGSTDLSASTANRFCEECGEPLPPNSKFCQKCGVKLNE